MGRTAPRATPSLWSDLIAASVVNKRLAVLEAGGFYTAALFQITVIQAIGLTVFSCRIYGSIDGATFPAVNAGGEALVSTAAVLAVGTSILRQPTILPADGGSPQPPRIFPPFLVLEYTATLLTRFQFEVRAVFEAADRPGGVEHPDEPPFISPAAVSV